MKYAEAPYRNCIGKISLIQEPGFKLRAVANPNRVLQAALQPLKVVLGETLSRVGQDSTFDQSAGVEAVRGWLAKGIKVHSVDLSDATNLFPLNFTASCLRALKPQDLCEDEYLRLVELFVEASRMPFFSKLNGITEVFHFTRGQPLGLGPSFFAFALSHHFLLHEICSGLHVKADCYRILGDDIVIASDTVHNAYLNRLAELGCKVSVEKSFSSTDMAEFAGKIITRNSVIPQFKWRELSDQNLVDFCRNLGPRSVGLLSPRQKELIAFLAAVPTFLGGLGWNPKGIPLADRLSEPFTNFILNKRVEVLVPSIRVDQPLVRFASDPRLRDLTPCHKHVDSLKQFYPTRVGTVPQWGTEGFLHLFNLVRDYSGPLQDLIGETRQNPILKQGFYIPMIKECSDPRQSTPWFDVLNYFKSIQLRQDAYQETSA
jgi:hypothetical protein